MAKGLSDLVREVAERDYVRPAMMRGQPLEIRVGDLQETLRVEKGFPPGHINQICNALESTKFLSARLELSGGKGKPRKVSTVYQFSVIEKTGAPAPAIRSVSDPLLKLRGVLRGAIREGADTFVREMRRDKESGQ